jgi:hypothetical protein
MSTSIFNFPSAIAYRNSKTSTELRLNSIKFHQDLQIRIANGEITQDQVDKVLMPKAKREELRERARKAPLV